MMIKARKLKTKGMTFQSFDFECNKNNININFIAISGIQI
jgi:hypothetical protein